MSRDVVPILTQNLYPLTMPLSIHGIFQQLLRPGVKLGGNALNNKVLGKDRARTI